MREKISSKNMIELNKNKKFLDEFKKDEFIKEAPELLRQEVQLDKYLKR
tara:strand:+ start:605 stop:751 length:147 start_codon:yes stop_codon:yes gene_type:complete